MIDRLSGGSHVIISTNLTDTVQNSAKILDGDDISVFPVDAYRRNIVQIQGQVIQPGAYGLHDSMRISDLIMDGKQLLPTAYTERADLVRTLPDLTREIRSINLDMILSNPEDTNNFILRNEDLLVVYSIWDIKDKPVVAILGSVRKPGEYELFNNMRISDLVFESGGLTRTAYSTEAEIARVSPGEQAKVIRVDLKQLIESPGSDQDLLLTPYDMLFIRDVPGWKLQDVVTIVGEVQFPGKYALEKNDERLSDLIRRAGSFTQDAFLNGVVYIRPSVVQNAKSRNLYKVVHQTQEAVLDSEGNVITSPYLFTYSPELLARIIIDLDRAITGHTEDDIILEAGDSIYVPQKPTGVNVVGMIASSGTIHWLPGKNIRYYLDRAGGLTRNADEGGIRLVKANGKVVKASMRTTGVEPGDAIIVPQQIKKKTDWGTVLSQSVSVLTGLVTTLYIILKL
jgi:protein involved in polysaccharide export with SLBB domain